MTRETGSAVASRSGNRSRIRRLASPQRARSKVRDGEEECMFAIGPLQQTIPAFETSEGGLTSAPASPRSVLHSQPHSYTFQPPIHDAHSAHIVQFQQAEQQHIDSAVPSTTPLSQGEASRAKHESLPVSINSSTTFFPTHTHETHARNAATSTSAVPILTQPPARTPRLTPPPSLPHPMRQYHPAKGDMTDGIEVVRAASSQAACATPSALHIDMECVRQWAMGNMRTDIARQTGQLNQHTPPSRRKKQKKEEHTPNQTQMDSASRPNSKSGTRRQVAHTDDVQAQPAHFEPAPLSPYHETPTITTSPTSTSPSLPVPPSHPSRSMPLPMPLPMTQLKRRPRPASTSRNHALIVYTTPLDQRIMQAALQQCSMNQCHFADSMESIAQHIATNQYRLILIDAGSSTQQQNMSPVEIAHVVREAERSSNNKKASTGILVISDSIDPSIHSIYAQAGINGCLQRGCVLAEAIAKMMNACEEENRFLSINRDGEMKRGEMINLTWGRNEEKNPHHRTPHPSSIAVAPLPPPSSHPPSSST